MNKRKWSVPLPGQRIFRSMVAVILCFVIYELRGRQGIPFYSAIAVLQCMQPYRQSMKKVAKKRVTGTAVGAFWGMIVLMIDLYVLPVSYRDSLIPLVLAGIFTGVVLYFTVLLQVTEAAYFSCVVFLSITVNHVTDVQPLLFVANRVLDTLIGVLLAAVVNMVHLPREKKTDILFVSGVDNTIVGADGVLSDYSKITLNRLIDEGCKFTVSTMETPATVRELLPGVHLKYPIIVMDGAALYDMNQMEYYEVCKMKESEAIYIRDLLNQHGYHAFMNTIEDNLLVTYFDKLANDAMRATYEKRRKSPYRNFVRRSEIDMDSVVYFFVEDTEERIWNLKKLILNSPNASLYRMSIAVSEDDANYRFMKIYSVDATRERMREKLFQRVNAKEIVTFGSIEGRCDVLIENADKNMLVKELKHRFEPVKGFLQPGKLQKRK